MLVCRVRVNVNTLGEEPRWPVVEIQALTSLPLAGHGPVAVNPVYVRIWFHGFQLPLGAHRKVNYEIERNLRTEPQIIFVNAGSGVRLEGRCPARNDA